MFLRILPPILEHAVVVAAVKGVMEPQTEARSGHSQWPDLGVLAVAPFRPTRPLIGQELRNAGVRP